MSRVARAIVAAFPMPRVRVNTPMPRRFVVLTLLFVASPAQAWNTLGHKVIADIAWLRLGDATRQQIAQTLRHHPQFDRDFAKQGDANDDRWIFQQAATWPDIIRKQKEYDHPSWHYIDLALGGQAKFNVAMKLAGPADSWNAPQAIEYCRKTLAGNAPPAQKALAYCWLEHLVGDVHQPLHSTALVNARFPEGDRGGNSIPVRQGKNLHSLWDNLLGRESRPNDVKREVAQLVARPALWKAEVKDDVPGWIRESHELAKSVVYSPEILAAVNTPGDLQPINLPEPYLKQAGETASVRVVAAGERLAMLLGGQVTGQPPSIPTTATERSSAETPPRATSTVSTKTGDSSSKLSYWLNTSNNIRHNSSCRYYHKTKQGRACGPDEGKACGICGG